MPKYLSQSQIEDWHRDGFVAPVDVLSEAQAADFRLRLEQAEQRWPQALTGVGRNNAHLSFSFLDELSHHPIIIDAVEDLIGPNLLICGTVLFIKEAHDDAFVSFHQDVTYMGLEPHDGVSAWLALTPSNASNGCMRMVPGSHRGSLHPHRDTQDTGNILTRGQTIDSVVEDSAVDIELAAGQMSLHSLKTIHDSRPNNSNDRRIGFTIQSYIPPHVQQSRGRMHVQLARGVDTHRHHTYATRVQTDMSAAAEQQRERVNKEWGDILYRGTSRERTF